MEFIVFTWKALLFKMLNTNEQLATLLTHQFKKWLHTFSISNQNLAINTSVLLKNGCQCCRESECEWVRGRVRGGGEEFSNTTPNNTAHLITTGSPPPPHSFHQAALGPKFPNPRLPAYPPSLCTVMGSLQLGSTHTDAPAGSGRGICWNSYRCAFVGLNKS